MIENVSGLSNLWIYDIFNFYEKELNTTFYEWYDDKNKYKNTVHLDFKGFLWYEHSAGVAYIKALAVNPDNQKQGVGQELVGWLKERFKDIYVATNSARVFYIKQGFMDIGDVNGFTILSYSRT